MANRNPKACSGRSSVQMLPTVTAKRLEWDVGIVDRFLYFLNTLIMLGSALLLLLILRPVDSSEWDITCTFPRNFTGSLAYGHRQCLYSATLFKTPSRYIPAIDIDKLNYTHIVERHLLFPLEDTTNYGIFSYRLFLLAAVSLAPLLCWRLVGFIDGAEFAVNSTFNKLILIMWYLLMKLGALAVCIVSLLIVNQLSVEGTTYLNKTSSNRQPREAAVYCNYWERDYTGHIDRQMVPCTVYQGSVGGEADGLEGLYVLTPILESLQMWLIFLLVLVGGNIVSVTVLAALSTTRAFRSSFISRNVLTQDDEMHSQIDQNLGTTGILVCSLAAKNGQGHIVRSLLAQIQRAEEGEGCRFLGRPTTVCVLPA